MIYTWQLSYQDVKMTCTICKANSKKEAIKKFLNYYTNASTKNVFSLEELYWIPNEDISILTTY
jgi:hypothetical protein